MTTDQANKLRMLAGDLRRIAQPVGPPHAFWDLIFDIEAFVEGRKTLLKHSADEWIAEASRTLRAHYEKYRSAAGEE